MAYDEDTEQRIRREVQERVQAEVEIARTQFWTRSVAYVCTALVLVAVIIVGGYHFTNRVAIEKGLCQGAIPGTTGWQWVACK